MVVLVPDGDVVSQVDEHAGCLAAMCLVLVCTSLIMLLKNMFNFPLLVLKGIYHYWKC